MKQRLRWFLLPQHANLCSYTTIKQSLKFNLNKYFEQWQADKLFRKGLNKSWKEIFISCAAWELPKQRISLLPAFKAPAPERAGVGPLSRGSQQPRTAPEPVSRAFPSGSHCRDPAPSTARASSPRRGPTAPISAASGHSNDLVSFSDCFVFAKSSPINSSTIPKH